MTEKTHAQKRRPYEAPRLIAHGNVASLTRAMGDEGVYDGKDKGKSGMVFKTL
jgi:hypothetical protein